jgi:hypothetical protein
MRSLVWSFCGVALAAAGCGDSAEPCEGPNGPCIEIAPGPDVQQEAQTALIEAVPATWSCFAPAPTS